MDPTFFELLAAEHFPTFIQPAFELFLEKAFPSPTWIYNNRAELFFALRLLVEHRHLGRDNASFSLRNFGLTYFNLKSPYGLSKTQHVLLLIGLVAIPYIRYRVKQYRHDIIHFMDDEPTADQSEESQNAPDMLSPPSRIPVSFRKCWDLITKANACHLQLPSPEKLRESQCNNSNNSDKGKAIVQKNDQPPLELTPEPLQTQSNPPKFNHSAFFVNDITTPPPSSLLPQHHQATPCNPLLLSSSSSSSSSSSLPPPPPPPQPQPAPKSRLDSQQTLFGHLRSIFTNIYSFLKFIISQIFISRDPWEPHCSDRVSTIFSSIRALIHHIKSLGMTIKLYLTTNFPIFQQFFGHWILLFYPWIHALLEGIDFISKVRFVLGYNRHWSFWLPLINVGIRRQNPHEVMPSQELLSELINAADPGRVSPPTSAFNPFNPLQSRLHGLFSARFSSSRSNSTISSRFSFLTQFLLGSVGLLKSLLSITLHALSSLLNWTADHVKLLIILALLCKQFIDSLYNQTLRQQQAILEQVSSLNNNENASSSATSPISRHFFSNIMHVPTNPIDFNALEEESPLALSRLLIGTDSNYPTLASSQSTSTMNTRLLPPPQWVSTGATIDLPINPSVNKSIPPTPRTPVIIASKVISPQNPSNMDQSNNPPTTPKIPSKSTSHSITRVDKPRVAQVPPTIPTHSHSHPHPQSKPRSTSTILDNPDQQHLVPLDLSRCQWCNEPPKAIAATLVGHCGCYKCIVQYVGRFSRCPFSHTPMTLDDIRSVWISD